MNDFPALHRLQQLDPSGAAGRSRSSARCVDLGVTARRRGPRPATDEVARAAAAPRVLAFWYVRSSSSSSRSASGGAFDPGRRRLAGSVRHAVDSDVGHSLHARRRRHRADDGAAHDVHHAAGGPRQLDEHPHDGRTATTRCCCCSRPACSACSSRSISSCST